MEDNKKEYAISTIAFPDIHDDQEKIDKVLDKAAELVYSINADYPDAIIVIYTPSISVFKPLMDNVPFVQLKFIENLDVYDQNILNSVHIWANAGNEKEERAVTVIQEQLREKKLYNVATFI